jgi:hypothetical protein
MSASEHVRSRARASVEPKRSVSSADLQIRIRVVHPPPGVSFAIQIGKSDLLPPMHVDASTLTFDFGVRVDSKRDGPPRFLGPVVQGPPAARFIYVNSGKRAGQATSCWDRRAKVPLSAITWATIDRARAAPNGYVQACLSGCAGDGGPACASVALLGNGWEVISA